MQRRIFNSGAILLASACILFGWAANASGDLFGALPTLAPAFFGSAISIALFVTLWQRSGRLPLFDLGMYMSLAIFLYLAIPVFQFVLSGFQHTVFSARQLYELNPTRTEFTSFSYLYLFYLVPFVIAYSLRVNLRTSHNAPLPAPPLKIDVYVLLLIYFVLQLFVSGIDSIFGTSQTVSYQADALDAQFQNFQSLPGGLQQLYVHTSGMLFIVKIAFIATVFANWSNRNYRYAFTVWLLFVMGNYYFQSGARTEIILVIFLSGLFYTKYVRSIPLSLAVAGGMFILTLFIAMGVLRQGGSIHESLNSLDAVSEYQGVAFSVANEFQTLFGGAYDLTQMVASGALKDVPLQLNFYELLMLVPQQFVPFEKIDVAQWYLATSSTGGYFMLNPVAQGAIGLGVVEIIIRGGLLGYIFATFTNYFHRNSQKFWVFVFYAWIITQCYYSIRSSSFYFLAFVFYRFIPLLIVLYLLQSFLGQSLRFKRKAHHSSISVLQQQ